MNPVFIIYILFLGIFFFANGYVLGLKHGFNKAKEIDDKIIDELSTEYDDGYVDGWNACKRRIGGNID